MRFFELYPPQLKILATPMTQSQLFPWLRKNITPPRAGFKQREPRLFNHTDWKQGCGSGHTLMEAEARKVCRFRFHIA